MAMEVFIRAQDDIFANSQVQVLARTDQFMVANEVSIGPANIMGRAQAEIVSEKLLKLQIQMKIVPVSSIVTKGWPVKVPLSMFQVFQSAIGLLSKVQVSLPA